MSARTMGHNNTRIKAGCKTIRSILLLLSFPIRGAKVNAVSPKRPIMVNWLYSKID
ncbi:MAG: hypothetical protein ACUVTD_05300 [Nitrososphaerales archaeon]